jgi:prevent-host-death family protein
VASGTHCFLTASEARANLYRLIDQTVESHQPIIISGKRNSAVLISAGDWSAIQETLYLLAVPGMRESIKAGMAEPLANSAKELDWRVGSLSMPSKPSRTRRSLQPMD